MQSMWLWPPYSFTNKNVTIQGTIAPYDHVRQPGVTVQDIALILYNFHGKKLAYIDSNDNRIDPIFLTGLGRMSRSLPSPQPL